MIIKTGTGRAHCRICYKLIKKGSCDVSYQTYQHETHHHPKCIFKKIKKWIENEEKSRKL